MKYCFIVNPAAGQKNNSEKWIRSIRTACEARTVDYEIHLTNAIGDATEWVRHRCEILHTPMRIYACGGDGTFNEVVNGAAGFPFAQVGIIPSGTGNDFVRNFSDSPRFLDLNAQLDGKAYLIDLIKINDRYCVNMINIGFDCEVVRKTGEIKKNPLIPPGMAYLAGVLGTVARKPGVIADVSLDGAGRTRVHLLLNAIGNGSYCGGGYFAAPAASLVDGKMDVVQVHDLPRRKFPALIGEYKSGTYLTGKGKEEFDAYSCRKVDMYFPGPQAVCVDGEIADQTEIHLTVEHNALNLIVPFGCAFTRGRADVAPESME